MSYLNKTLTFEDDKIYYYDDDLRSNREVMMEWEQPYMETCIDILEPSGSVLEIGFGLGYSAKKLCLNENVKKYSVIECSPIVWKKFENFHAKVK